MADFRRMIFLAAACLLQHDQQLSVGCGVRCAMPCHVHQDRDSVIESHKVFGILIYQVMSFQSDEVDRARTRRNVGSRFFALKTSLDT